MGTELKTFQKSKKFGSGILVFFLLWFSSNLTTTKRIVGADSDFIPIRSNMRLVRRVCLSSFNIALPFWDLNSNLKWCRKTVLKFGCDDNF